jgi:hypothetical protein
MDPSLSSVVNLEESPLENSGFGACFPNSSLHKQVRCLLV